MRVAIATWFGVSILVAVTTNIALFVWLRRRQASMLFSLTGMPEYLDLAYLRWCREQKRSSAAVLWFRAASLANLLGAAWAFIVFVAQR